MLLYPVMLGPFTAKELAFPRDHPNPQLVLVDCYGTSGMARKCRFVCVMSREPIWCRLLCRPVVLGVEDRRLLPKASFHIQNHDLAVPVEECHREDVRHPGPHWVTADWPLVRERAELKFHRPLEVLEPGRLRRRVPLASPRARSYNFASRKVGFVRGSWAALGTREVISSQF
jgi:hypothetical protein